MKEEEHRLYGRPCLLVQLYADGSVCFQAFNINFYITRRFVSWLFYALPCRCTCGEGLIDRYCSPSLIHYCFQEVSMQAILDQIADWL